MNIEDKLGDWVALKSVKIRRRIRILMLLDAVDYAVISPIEISRFHTLAFLADVLSPLYKFASLSGRILKRRVGPYFPELQWEIDRLIGLNLVIPSNLNPIIESTGAHMNASLSLERMQSEPILKIVYSLSEFHSQREFFRELAGALSSIEDEDLDAATRSDVTWAAGHMGTVIDYAEWRAKNYTAMSADKIDEIADQLFGKRAVQLSPGAKINLYVRYMRRVINE